MSEINKIYENMIVNESPSDDKKTIQYQISVNITSSKNPKDVISALKRAIYRGLDTEPNYIAQPKDVEFNYVVEWDKIKG